VVDPEVGDEVPDGHVGPAEARAEEVKSGGGEGNANIGEDNLPGILLLVQGAARVKVVDAAAVAVVLALAAALALALVVVVAGDVGHEVVGPADELLGEEHDEGVNGGLLGQLSELVDGAAETGGVLLAGAGDEDHVALHVAGGLVVLAVGDLPAEVGDEEGRMKEPSGDIVDHPAVGEGAVAALVGNDPEAGAEEALEDGVETPKGGASGRVGNELRGNVVVPDGEGGSQASHVAQDVAVTLDGGPLEAVLGDGVADILDCEVGDGELVAVRVEQLAHVGGLLRQVVHFRHGRERGGRGRGARRV
jgi:hypothetical protein